MGASFNQTQSDSQTDIIPKISTHTDGRFSGRNAQHKPAAHSLAG